MCVGKTPLKLCKSKSSLVAQVGIRFSLLFCFAYSIRIKQDIESTGTIINASFVNYQSSPSIFWFNSKWGSIAHNLSLSSSHRPEMTEILLKRT